MKTVLLAPTPPPYGGIASWTQRMLKAQLKNGWELSVVDEKMIGKRNVFGGKKESRRNLVDEIKRCHRIWSGLKRELKDEQVKIVHSCIPSATLSMMREYVCACITKRRGRKFIIHFRCTVPNTTKSRLGKILLKKLCKKSDFIITLNSQTNDYLDNITDTPYELIPNFISEDEITDDYKIQDEIKTVLYVGGVVKTKGAYDFISVAEMFPNIQFRMVGRVDTAIEEYTKSKGLKNTVFTGPKDKAGVKEELKNADIFMFLTYFGGEGFSNSLCEAMAAGLPCIVTDWAANKDMIGEDGGCVVPIKDTGAAASAIERMKGKQMRMKCSSTNRKKVINSYIEKIVVDKYIDIYERLIGEGTY